MVFLWFSYGFLTQRPIKSPDFNENRQVQPMLIAQMKGRFGPKFGGCEYRSFHGIDSPWYGNGF